MPSAKSAQKKSDVTTSEPVETKKTKSSKTEQKSVASTSAAVAPAKAKKETKKGTVAPTLAPVVDQPVVEEANVVVVTDSPDSVTENFTEFIAKFQTMLSSFSALKTELKTLERKTMKQLKVVQKINNKKKKKGLRAPSGFVKPAPISDELAQFLGRPEGSEMARTDVTREINKYIRAHDLQDKSNGRKIIPDKSLCALLKIDDEVNLTYFNLQRYMGPHFPKQVKTDSTNNVVLK